MVGRVFVVTYFCIDMLCACSPRPSLASLGERGWGVRGFALCFDWIFDRELNA